MDLNQLKSFLAVTQTLNFTSAAKQIGVPQSTVSRQINDLESQLKTKLFYRTKRDVQLTVEGRTFLPYAREILDAAQKGTEAVRQLQNGCTGRLSIAAVSSSGLFVSDCLALFGRRFSDIRVDVTFVPGGEALQDEGQDLYDFHFMPRDMLPYSEEFDTLDTHRDRLCLAAPKGHELNPDQLQWERFILLSESENPILYMLVMDFFRSRRFSPRIVNETDDARTVLLSVSAGLGLTILPLAQTRMYFRDTVDVYPLDMEIIYAAAWKKSLLNPAARLFLDVLLEKAGTGSKSKKK